MGGAMKFNLWNWKSRLRKWADNPNYLCLLTFALALVAAFVWHLAPISSSTWGSLTPNEVCKLFLYSLLLVSVLTVFSYIAGRHMLPVLMLFLGLAGLSVIIVFFSHAIEILRTKSTDPMGYASLVLDWTAMGATIVTIVAGLTATWIGWKVNQIRGSQEKIQRNLVASAEIALRALPPFEESQQIPTRCLAPLADISAIIFDDMDRSIVDFLDRTGNGVRLRLAKASYLYGAGGKHYKDAWAVLKEALEKAKNSDYRHKKLAYYRIGIVERQLGYYEASIKSFSSLATEALRHGDPAFLQHACVGIAVSLLALFNDSHAKLNVNQIVKRFVGPLLVSLKMKVGEKDVLLECAFSLLSFVNQENIHHVMGSMYLAKVCYESDGSGNSLVTMNPGTGGEAAERTLVYLQRLPIREDLNIEANYEWSRAVCLSFLKRNDEAKECLEKAIRLAKSLLNTHPDVELYSEFEERQIPVKTCINQIKRFRDQLSIKAEAKRSSEGSTGNGS
jgi:tetratricopeptide (TPR) repeat protein